MTDDVGTDCDKGKICPKCGKVMIRGYGRGFFECRRVRVESQDSNKNPTWTMMYVCEDEKTSHQYWICDRCGYKEEE